MKKLIKTLILAGLVGSAAFGLAACGKKGELQPPPSYQN